MKLPQSWTTVTTLSKILALVMFVGLPFIGFYFGYQYGIRSISQPPTTSSPEAIPTEALVGNDQDNDKPTEENEPFVLSKENLVGVWQDSGGVAAGYTNHYVFYPSGKYSFNYNQMNCAKQLSSESGLWEFNNKTHILTLMIKQQTILRGGKLVDSSGSCGTEKDWEGGTWETEPVSKEIKMKYQLSVPTEPFKVVEEYTYNPNDSSNPYEVVIFNDKPFWEIISDFNWPGAGEEFPEPTGF